MTKAQQREQILAYAKGRGPYPILVGSMARELGWWARLVDIEAFLDEMVDDGLLHRLTPEECYQNGIRHGYVLPNRR